MRNELSFSIERNELINAERAYELYWSEAIRNQQAFRCPDITCPAAFTCVNMYRAANELKQQPHFRARVEHKVNCDFLDDIVKQTLSRSGTSGSPGDPAAALPDRFLLSRPANDLVKIIATDAVRTNVQLGTKQGNDWIAAARRRSTEFYSIGRLVSRWLQARKTGTANSRTVQFASGAPLTYSQAFVSLYPRGRQIPGIARVYWGKARIRRSKDNSSYVLYFSEPVSTGSLAGPRVLLKPLMILRDDDLAQNAMRKATAHIISDAIKNDDSWCTAFSYSTPKPPKSGAFLDLTPTSVDFLAIEPIALLSELE